MLGNATAKRSHHSQHLMADSLDKAEQLAVGNAQLLQRIQQAREALQKKGT